MLLRHAVTLIFGPFFHVFELTEFRYCVIIQIIKDIVPPGGVGGGAGVRDAFFFMT